MPALRPTDKQYKAFLEETSYAGPLSQVNLLKFRDKAEYQPDDPEHGDNCSGEVAYFRYADVFNKMALQVGCVTTLVATAEQYFIGGGDWDCVIVNTFPSREAFLTMVQHPEYSTIARHRTAGLLCQELIVTRPIWLHGEKTQ